jgi:four helix bundle protein
MSLAEEEADETEYWLELLDELQHAPEAPLRKRRDEVHQITSMIVASIKTVREEG